MNFPFKNKSIKGYSVGQLCAKIWNFLFLRFLHLALKVAKNYTYTGEVLYVCWRSTYTGEVLYVYGRPILRNFTYTGEVFYVYGRFTYTGEVFYVYWRFTYTGATRVRAVRSIGPRHLVTEGLFWGAGKPYRHVYS